MAEWIDEAITVYRDCIGTANEEPAMAYLQAIVRLAHRQRDDAEQHAETKL